MFIALIPLSRTIIPIMHRKLRVCTKKVGLKIIEALKLLKKRKTFDKISLKIDMQILLHGRTEE